MNAANAANADSVWSQKCVATLIIEHETLVREVVDLGNAIGDLRPGNPKFSPSWVKVDCYAVSQERDWISDAENDSRKSVELLVAAYIAAREKLSALWRAPVELKGGDQ